MQTKIYRLGRAEFLVYRRSRGTFAQQSRNGCRVKWVRFAADHPPGTMGVLESGLAHHAVKHDLEVR